MKKKFDSELKKNIIAELYRNKDYIISEIDKEFENQKDNIKSKLLSWIVDMIDEPLIHYEWSTNYSDNFNPYDYSGGIKECGYVDLEQTIYSFLENEYTGNKSATYCSNYGWSFDTYGKEMSYETLDIAGKILSEIIYNNISSIFASMTVEASIIETSFDNIAQDIYEDVFDEFYSESMAFDFFNWEPPVCFVGIENIKLKEAKEIFINEQKEKEK